jgi:hypothetical protein
MYLNNPFAFSKKLDDSIFYTNNKSMTKYLFNNKILKQLIENNLGLGLLFITSLFVILLIWDSLVINNKRVKKWSLIVMTKIEKFTENNQNKNNFHRKLKW